MVKQELKKLKEKYEDKLDKEKDRKETLIKSIEIRANKSIPISNKPIEGLSLHTGKFQINRKEIKPLILDHKEAGSFAKPNKIDMDEIKKLKESAEKIRRALILEYKKIKRENKVPSGIPGFDELCEGGFEPESINLVAGGPGSGKTIFCMQFIVKGIIDYNEPGIYITFEETKIKFYEHMKRFGWDIEKLEKEGKLIFMEYNPSQIKKLLEEGGGQLEANVRKIGAKRLVIDSITSFTLLFEDEYKAREATLKLFNILSKLGCTTLITAEYETDPDKHTANPVEFESDGVILLYNLRRRNIRVRAIEIYKMRGVDHKRGIFPMRITQQGIVVYPNEEVF